MKHKDKLKVGWTSAYEKGFKNVSKKVNYFSDKEMRCPCCHENKIKPEFLAVLNRLREQFGPMAVGSGYRCEKHNVSIGGAKGSAHVLGLAADIKLTDPTRKRDFMKLLLDGPDFIDGIGIYNHHVHLDIKERSHGRGVIWSGVSK